MADSDKNIVIVPNRGATDQPSISFTGQGNDPIVAYVLDGTPGVLSIEGSAGQLFSITNNLTSGSIFSVNDVSGIPSLDINADGTVSIASFGGNVGVGLTNPSQKLDVSGSIRASSQLISTIATGTAPLSVSSTTLVTNLNADLLDGLNAASTNTASTIVARDGSGNFSAGTITAALSGNATTATTWATGRTIALTGDVTGTSGAFNGSANLSFATTLANSGVTAGTYRSVTVDVKGRVTAGTNPTTIAGYGITDAVTTSGNQTINGNKTFTGSIVASKSQITKNAHVSGADDFHLELLSGSVDIANEVSLRMHQSGQWWGQIRLRSDGFHFTQGDNNTYRNIFAGTLTAALSGNATTATTLATTRTIWGQNFNGSANVTGNLTSVGDITGTGAITISAGGTNQNITLTPSGTGTINAPTFNATSTTNGGFQGIATDSVNVPSFTWTEDLTTGIYRPGTNQVGITLAGTNRATFAPDLITFRRTNTDPDSTANSSFTIDYNLSGSTTPTTNRSKNGLYIDLDHSSTGGTTTNGQRETIYGMTSDVDTSGTPNGAYGVYGAARSNNTTGTITSLVGVRGYAEGDSGVGGTTTSVYGVQGDARDGGAGTVSNVYGAQFYVLKETAATVTLDNAVAMRAEVEIDGNTITTTKAGEFVIDIDGGTLTNAYLTWAKYEGTIQAGCWNLYYPSDAPSYVEGEFRLGANTDLGGEKLQVTGDARITGSCSANTLISTVATGTAPLSVTSTTLVTNLNADLLDGIDSGSFLRSDANDSFSGIITNSGSFISSNSGISAAGFDKIRLGRSDSQYMSFWGDAGGNGMASISQTSNPKGNLRLAYSIDGGATLENIYSLTGSSGTVWTTGNDGSGSGLDADTVDGIDSGSFLRSDADDSFSGTITGTSGISGPSLIIDGGGPNTIRFLDNGSITLGIDLVFRTSANTLGFEKAVDGSQLWKTDCDTGVTDFSYDPTVSGNTIWHAGNDGAGSGLDADLLDGLQLHTGRNDEADKVVRTDDSGYIQAGWINTTSGSHSFGVDKVFSTYVNDNYIRYCTPDHLANSMSNVLHTDANDDASGSYLFIRNNPAISNTSYSQGNNHIELRTTDASSPILGFHRLGNSATALYHSGYGINSLRMRNDDGNDGPIFSTFNDGSGSGLDADLLDGENLVDSAATANTVVGRNSTGDVHVRLIRQTYQDQSIISGGIVYRINNSNDNYLRVCNNTGAIRTFLDVPTRTGGDASGTWDIDITGEAATVTNGLYTNTTFGGDVSGTYNAIVVADDSHSHAFNNLTGKTSGTGEYATTGNIVSGKGGGGVALTVNDGKGNANVTFNHQSGVPEQTGNAARIEVNTDSVSNATIYFEGKSNVSGGTSVDLNNWFTMSDNGATCLGNTVWHAGNHGSGSGLDADLLDGKNTGTSGNTIPLLDGTNTWSNTQTFSSRIIATNTFNVNGSSAGGQVDGLYVADLGGTVGTTLNPIFTAAICAQVNQARSIALTIDSSGYLWGFRSHSNTATYTFTSRTVNSDTLTTTRSIWGQNFNGGANVTGNLTSVGDITGTGAITITAGGTGSVTIATANSPINLRSGSSRVRIYDDSDTFYHNIATGTTTANRTLTLADGNTTLVTGTMVPTTTSITISGGTGITSSAGAQNLSANRTWTLSVDSTVIRTTGDYIKDGSLTIKNGTNSGLMYYRREAASANNKLWRAGCDVDNSFIIQGLDDAGSGSGYYFRFIRSGNAVNRFDFMNGASGWGTIRNDTARMGLGTLSPGYRLDLPNTANVEGRGRSNQWVVHSDGRIKSDRQTIPYGLDTVMSLTPIKYFQHNSKIDAEGNLIISENEGDYSIGLIAQDVENIVPEVVTAPEDPEKDLYALDYSKLTTVLIKAVQEQQAMIEELRAEIEALKSS